MFTYTPTSNIMIKNFGNRTPPPPVKKTKTRKTHKHLTPLKDGNLCTFKKSNITKGFTVPSEKNKMLVQYTKCLTPQEA